MLRIAFLLTKRNTPSFGDTAEYEAVAMHFLGLASGPTLPRAPAYPALMALGFLIGGVKNYMAIRWLQLPLGIALVELVRRIATHVAGPRAGIIAGLAAAVAPTLVFVSSMLYPTSLYTFLLAAITLAALRLEARPRLLTGALLGLLIVLGLLTDTVLIAPLVAIGLWLLLRTRVRGADLARALGAALVTILLILLPYRMIGQQQGNRSQVFIAKGQWVLHYARTDSSVNQYRKVRLPLGEKPDPRPLPEFLHHEAQLAIEQPAAYLYDIGFEFGHFFAPMPDRIQTRNMYNQPNVLLLGAIYFTPVLLLSFIGLFQVDARRDQRILLAGIICATAGFYACFFSQTRYRIPIEPQMLVLAALAVNSLWKPGQTRRVGEASSEIDLPHR
ncbi:MAG: glycosyltransferase family 39 protein [Candidatus Eisenbacteria bacterium]